jgi:hypothetical protein
VTSCIATTESASTRLESPDPCVPVELAPATEMWGSEPMLGRASPAAWSTGATSP